MANFMFSMNNLKVPIEHLPHGSLRESAYKFAAPFIQKLQSLHCKIHNQEPLFILETKGDKIALKGVGFCCTEFAQIVRNQGALPGKLIDTSTGFTTTGFTDNDRP